MPHVKIGRVLLNQYRVDEFIGGGGVGLVFKVKDLLMNTNLAMKVLNIDTDDDPSSTFLFKREAKAYEALAHPNIVRYYGLKRSEDIIFLLLDYIDGDSLQKILSKPQYKKLPLPDVLAVFKAISAALGYAHKCGVVHCDIKPGNILVDQGGKIYLTDFGIARHIESTATDIGTAGTISYMAPEQFLQEPLNASTDIYAMGILLYEMLIGQKPFRPTERSTSGQSRTAREMLQEAHLKEEAPDPCLVRKDLPADLGQVVLKALHKDPKKRYQTTQEFFHALCIACDVSEFNVKDRIAPKYVEKTVDDDKGSSPEPVPSPKSWSKTKPPLWSYLVAGLAVVGVVLYAFLAPKPEIVVPTAIQDLKEKDSQPTPQMSLRVVSPTDQNTPTFSITSTSVLVLSTQPATEQFYRAGDYRVSPTDGMIVLYVPEGDFLMGSSYGEWGDDEEPQHTVFLDAFWIDQTEVTNDMYKMCVEDGACSSPASSSSVTHHSYYGNSLYSNYPVIYVNWEQANKYCEWAGRRLPTEAEWEKAGRGEYGSIFAWGNSFSCRNGNFDDETKFDDYTVDGGSNCDGFVETASVGSFPSGASPYGALDMAGNVWEWVADWYDASYPTGYVVNPTGPDSGTERVMRGGSWDNIADYIRIAKRLSNNPLATFKNAGFRCAQD